MVDSERDVLYELAVELGAPATDLMRAMVRYFHAHPDQVAVLGGILQEMRRERQAARLGAPVPGPAKRARKRTT